MFYHVLPSLLWEDAWPVKVGLIMNSLPEYIEKNEVQTAQVSRAHSLWNFQVLTPLHAISVFHISVILCIFCISLQIYLSTYIVILIRIYTHTYIYIYTYCTYQLNQYIHMYVCM